MRLSTTSLLKYAGLFTWASVGIALLMTPLIGRDELAREHGWLWAVSHLAFGGAYWRAASGLESRRNLREQLLLLALMTLAGLVISVSSKTGLGGILLLVVAGLLPWLLEPRWGIPWLIGQNVLMAGIIAWSFPEMSATRAAINWGLLLGYQSFTFVLSLVGRRQALAREELRKVNSELRATQALLAESTRIAERVRISRELHDLVGHHLTALSLNLEVASHLVSGKALEHVAQARSVAKLLLSDVREVVGSMRSDDQVDLSQALTSLTEGVPRPKIHLDIPAQLAIDDPRRAQIVLRCTQEIITNTVKHADAENLWLSIQQDGEGLTIEARDDGRGTDELSEGNGLMGMGERLRQFGGKLSVRSSLGQGFALNAWLPKEVGL